MGLVGTVKNYKCDICGKESKWKKGWKSKLIPHKTWDEYITVCSDKCANIYDTKGKQK